MMQDFKTNKNSLILYNTFSFLLIIPLLLLIEYIFIEFKVNVGFYFGWIIGNVMKKIWSEHLYVDYIETENNKLTIKYLNPILKKGIEEYDLENILNFRIKKRIFFRSYGIIEFEFNGLKKKFVFLKIDLKMIINETKRIVKRKKTSDRGNS
jgi:hypothetical protein